jgi:ubiquinone/menaquinone biosynthesis C-methylase UbiE
MTQSNAADLPFPDASFDVAVSLSTIEHIGLDWYAPINAESTDHGAMAELLRVLKPGGRLLLTVPFGRPVTTRVHRVYDSARLDALLQPFRRVETLYGARDENCWSITRDGKEAERMDSAQRVSAVALVVAERP